MLATCICLNGSLLDQLSCTIVYLHNLFTCTFGRINMSVCLSVWLVLLSMLMEVIYRILNGLYPSYLNDIITVEELQHLRCRSRLFIPPFSTVRRTLWKEKSIIFVTSLMELTR